MHLNITNGGMTDLALLGQLDLGPYLHSIAATPNASPTAHAMLTIKFKL